MLTFLIWLAGKRWVWLCLGSPFYRPGVLLSENRIDLIPVYTGSTWHIIDITFNYIHTQCYSMILLFSSSSKSLPLLLNLMIIVIFNVIVVNITIMIQYYKDLDRSENITRSAHKHNNLCLFDCLLINTLMYYRLVSIPYYEAVSWTKSGPCLASF